MISGALKDQELDLMMLVGSFQLKVFYDFNILSLYNTLLVTRNTGKVLSIYSYIFFLCCRVDLYCLINC